MKNVNLEATSQSINVIAIADLLADQMDVLADLIIPQLDANSVSAFYRCWESLEAACDTALLKA